MLTGEWNNYEIYVNKSNLSLYNLSKLIHHSKSKTVSNFFYLLKVHLNFIKNISEGNITLEKAEEQQKKFKLELNEIVKGRKKSEEQISS